MTVLSWAQPKARKDHVCSACRRTIDAGAYYVMVVHMVGKDLVCWKAHPVCDTLASAYAAFHALDGDDDIPDWDEVLAWAKDHYNGGSA